MVEHPELLAALLANLSLLREVGLRYDVATDNAHTKTGGECTARTPEDVDDLNADMRPMVQEQLRVMLLNTKQVVIDVVTVYQGTVNSASVRVAEVLRPAIMANAPAIIMVHNHPSGDTAPSGADLQITRRVVKAAQVMDIEVHDHVIVAAGADPLSMHRRGIGGLGV